MHPPCSHSSKLPAGLLESSVFVRFFFTRNPFGAKQDMDIVSFVFFHLCHFFVFVPPNWGVFTGTVAVLILLPLPLQSRDFCLIWTLVENKQTKTTGLVPTKDWGGGQENKKAAVAIVKRPWQQTAGLCKYFAAILGGKLTFFLLRHADTDNCLLGYRYWSTTYFNSDALCEMKYIQEFVQSAALAWSNPSFWKPPVHPYLLLKEWNPCIRVNPLFQCASPTETLKMLSVVKANCMEWGCKKK